MVPAAMENQPRYCGPCYVCGKYWTPEASAGPAPGVPAAAEGGSFGEALRSFQRAYDRHESHANPTNCQQPTPEVTVRRGGDAEYHGDHGDQEFGPLPPAQQDPADAEVRARGQRRGPGIRFTPWQVEVLETVFQETQYPDVFRR